MVRNVALSVCLMGSCIWFLGLASRADSAQVDPPRESFKPVSSVESLMHGQGVFFKKIRKELKNPANKKRKKRNKEIHEAAEVLAELANVNRFNRDKDDYRRWAIQLRDYSLELAVAAKKGDASDEQLNAIVKKMGAACGACHDAYQ